MTEVETRQHRSVSQYNQYQRCPYSYYLSRIQKSWQRPAAWLPQGSAVHTVAEIYEKKKLEGNPLSLDEAQDLFREEYAKEIEKYTETTPNFQFWFSSGPYHGEVDIERRYNLGLEQVERFINWTESQSGRAIWIAPDGTPGIEIGFDFDLDGVLIRGFIDAVTVVDGQVEVIDYKTGNNPGDDLQLGVYGVALADQFGIDPPKKGSYWMGRSGKLTYPFDISEWTRDRVSKVFRQLEDDIQAERFEPKPDPKTCAFCDVNLSCSFRAD